MSQEVAIIGIGMTKFGELWDRSFRQLFVEAGAGALEDAGVKSEEVGALFMEQRRRDWEWPPSV